MFCGKEKKKERLSLWSLEPLVVNTLILVVSLFGRGDRVIGLLPLVRGGVLVCNPLR